MWQYTRLLRKRNFLLVWLGGAISNVGDFFNSVALVKVLSSDAAHFGLLWGLILVAKMLPSILLGPIAGVVADRLPRRAIMLISDLLRAVLVLGLVLTDNATAIVTLVFLAACVSAFHSPAASALTPNLVSSDELVTAGAMSQITSRLAQLIGNGLGAVALVTLGAHNVFYIDAASFMVCALLMLALKLPADTPASEGADAKTAADQPASLVQKFGSDVREALAFIKGSQPVRRLITTFSLAAVGDSAMNVLLPIFFTAALGISVDNLGYVWAAFAGTSVLGALVIGAIGNKVPWRYLMSMGAIYIYAMTLGMLLSTHAITGGGFMALLGLGSGAINVGANAAVSLLVPDHIRGRLFSAFGMMQSVIFVLGTLGSGALSDLIGPTKVLLAFTVFYAVAGVYAFFAFRHSETDHTVAAPAAD